MPREIRFNAFDMNCVGHIQQGLWAHPRDRSSDYCNIHHWTRLAQTLEAGLFDGIFFADVLGAYDVYGGSVNAALRGAVQVPVNDPSLLISAMSAATRHLGFGITANLTYEAPYLFARRMSTLDHLSGGRIGWNIVTGYLDSAARAIGLDGQMAHDDRYDLAEEYMEVVYKLWEGSWEDGAVVRNTPQIDGARRMYADPAKVHAIHHQGRQYKVDAIHLAEPSPQRTPLLYQAGSSTRGRQFAGTHAECVFLNGQSKSAVAAIISDIRSKAVATGRDATDLKMFVGTTIITGRTEAEAQEKYADYARYVDPEAALVHAAASLGIDFSKYDMDESIPTKESNAIVSNVESINRSAGPAWTKRTLLAQMPMGSRQVPMVGSAGAIADALIAWTEEADVDGFNLSRTVTPECFEDFIALVVPILQERGVYKTAYGEGTARDRMFGHAHLPASHPAARYRVATAGPATTPAEPKASADSAAIEAATLVTGTPQ